MELAARIKDLIAKLEQQEADLEKARAETTRLASERDAALLEKYWPCLRGRWTPPRAEAYPVYQRFRRQTLILKIPDAPASDYIDQVAEALKIIRQPF